MIANDTAMMIHQSSNEVDVRKYSPRIGNRTAFDNETNAYRLQFSRCDEDTVIGGLRLLPALWSGCCLFDIFPISILNFMF